LAYTAGFRIAGGGAARRATRTTMRRLNAGFCASLCLCAGAALAQGNAQAPDTAGAAEAVVKRIDPTDFRNRIELRANVQEQQSGAYRSRLIPRFEYAASKRLSLRLETPVVSYDPDTQGESRDTGFGDLLVRVSYRALRREGYAVVTALEATFDTASDETLGTGKYVLSPLAFAAIDVPKIRSTFFAGAQQYVSVAGDPDRQDINYTQLRTVLLTRWPQQRMYTVVDGQYYIDWERDADFGMLVEAEIGRFLSKNVALWLRPGVGVYDNDLPQVYKWNLEVGFRYIFD